MKSQSDQGSPLAEGQQLLQYLPQRPPMVMVDALLFSDSSSTRSSLTIEEDLLFVENGKFREAGLIENMAQTAAAGIGYHFLEEKGAAEVPLGFIASIKDSAFHRLPRVGEELRTEVALKQEVMTMSILNGEVRSGEELLAACEIRIHLQEEGSEHS